MDPYQVCNQHLVTSSAKHHLPTLKQLYISILKKKLSVPDIEKLLVQADKWDQRNIDLEELLHKLELKKKIAIVIPRLKKDFINLWTKRVPSWQNIDPYSSLEEEAETETETTVPAVDPTPTNSDISDSSTPKPEGRVLRQRKRTYSCTRSRRPGTDTKFYRDTCDVTQHKKDRKRKANILSTLKGPSANWQAAQKSIEQKKQGFSVNARLTQTYHLFQPIEHGDSTEHEELPDNTGTPTLQDSPAKKETDTDDKITARQDVTKPETLVKCRIKTHFVGIRRKNEGKKIRKYKCPNKDCTLTFESVAVLNDHFRKNHPPTVCPTCHLCFNTPSALSRHIYKHKKLEYVCKHCGKEFPFASDLNTHMNSHRTVKSFVCVKPKCGKSYFSKGELDKHVKTHSKKLWKCTFCTYTNRDQRNLKSHMRVHSGLKKYLCNNCRKLFKHDTQLRRHLPCTSEMRKKRERSPEY